jgi:F-type H+-transporting ATPase subunit delta
VVSATGIGNQSKKQLLQHLNELFKADIQMTDEENSDLIGGFILRIGDQQYDASLSSALKRIQKVMVN